MNSLETFKKKMAAFFTVGKKSSLNQSNSSEINQIGDSRNKTIMTVVLVLLCLLGSCFLLLNGQQKNASPFSTQETHEFGEVIDNEFSSQDAQSAEQDNASNLEDLTRKFRRFTQKNEQLVRDNSAFKEELSKQKQAFVEMKRVLEAQVQAALKSADEAMRKPSTKKERDDGFTLGFGQEASTNKMDVQDGSPQEKNPDPFYYPSQPRYADDKKMALIETHGQRKVSAQNLQSAGIDTFSFSSDQAPKELNYKNYVPAGSFVTAVMTGGAEANAGVGGESNTAPVTFKMLNQGFLPNGKHTKLKGCFMTASAYGDISSSRGIVRGDRLSCIRKNGSVLDIPIEATVFNFGKNGIRGNAVMRNSKIIGAAGTAGVLSGLGSAATGMSQTQSTSALGTTSSVNPSKVPLNILGGATEKVASQLSEYYIKLAEKYHPDIDLQQGAIVNIVFLKGFPLHGQAVDEYTTKLNQARAAKTQAVTQLTSNPVAVMKNSAKQSLNQLQGVNHAMP